MQSAEVEAVLHFWAGILPICPFVWSICEPVVVYDVILRFMCYRYSGPSAHFIYLFLSFHGCQTCASDRTSFTCLSAFNNSYPALIYAQLCPPLAAAILGGP